MIYYVNYGPIRECCMLELDKVLLYEKKLKSSEILIKNIFCVSINACVRTRVRKSVRLSTQFPVFPKLLQVLL